MSRFNPLNWFRRNPEAGDRERFARRAIDSGDEIMEPTSTRWPHELKILGMRRARVMGLSFGEYLRYLVARDIDSGTVPGKPCGCVTQNEDR